MRVDPATLRTSDPRDLGRGRRRPRPAQPHRRRSPTASAPPPSIHAALGGTAADRRGHAIELELRPGFRRLDTRLRRIPRVAGPDDADRAARRLRRGRDRLRRGPGACSRGCVACAASTTSCSTPELCILCGLCVDVCPTDCITIVRADRARRRRPRRSPRSCSTRTRASAAVFASTAARPARCRWCTPRSSSVPEHDRRDALEPGVARPGRGLVGTSAAQRGMALDVPPPAARHATRPGSPVVQQLLPPRLPRQDPRPRPADPLLVPPRLHRRGAVRHPADHRYVPHVRLHAVADRRLRRHAASEDRRRASVS